MRRPSTHSIHIAIGTDADVVAARQQGRELAEKLGFDNFDQTMIATAISEVARNIITQARRGKLTIAVNQKGTKSGIRVSACSRETRSTIHNRSGFPNLSTRQINTDQLSNTKSMMDEFRIRTGHNCGTTVVMSKWLL